MAFPPGALITPGEYLGVAKGGGVTTVVTAGTRVQLTATETNVTGVIVQATETNAGLIAVGGSDVVAALGAGRVCIQMLDAAQVIQVPIRNLSLMFLDATVSGLSVNFFPIKS